MKGHVDIILHDVNTGAEKHIEKDNMVTNAVAKYISSYLAWGGSRSAFNPIATTLLGGLRVFDDTLTENVNNFHFPSEAHLVGWADRSTNTTDVMRGSLNSLESGATSTGYKTTWDFNTSQGNGTIGSVALGNVLNPFRACLITGSSYVTPFVKLTTPDWTVRYMSTVFMSGNYAYLSYNTTSNSLPIYKMYVGPVNGIAVKDVYSELRSYALETTIDLSSYSFGTPGIPYNGRDGYLYISTVTSTDTFKYVKIKISDMSFDTELVTVTCSGCSFTTGVDDITIFGNLYAAIRKSDGTGVYIVNLANTSDVTLSEFSISSGLIGKSGRMINDVIKIQNVGILYADGTFVAVSSTGSMDNVGNWRPVFFENNLLIMDVENVQYGATTAYSAALNMCVDYIGTICNLSSPVTKTSAQTMKIVYTLTDA